MDIARILIPNYRNIINQFIRINSFPDFDTALAAFTADVTHGAVAKDMTAVGILHTIFAAEWSLFWVNKPKPVHK